MISFFTLSLLAVLVLLIYVFLTWNFDYWSKRGVTFLKPTPLLGSFPSLLLQKQHFADDINDVYKKYKHSDRYVGTFIMRVPQLLIVDPALAHEVFVTAFKHFTDNDLMKFVDHKKDPLIANNPFLLSNTEWRKQRALVSPGMTGSRIRVAYTIMQGVCENLCTYIIEEMKTAPKDGIDAKDLALRFTADNVCDSVLGIQAKSFTKQPVPIAKNVRMFADENIAFLVYSLISGLIPKLMNIYKHKFIPVESENFFINLMKTAVNIRETSQETRPDFMSHLLSLKEKEGLSDIELASHTMTFLIDGLDTTATVISHLLLMLAQNADTQEKLRQEILKNLDENDQLSFEKISDMPYLDACVHESLRIYPPGIFSTKQCTLPYEFRNKDGSVFTAEKGDIIMIPIYSFHHDPNIYPNPEEFKPQRFLPENGGVKKYRDEGQFLGFGDGPRTCLGMRFALTQTKAAISAIVRNFNIHLNPKTKNEYKLNPKAFLALHDGGVWLNFEKRL